LELSKYCSNGLYMIHKSQWIARKEIITALIRVNPAVIISMAANNQRLIDNDKIRLGVKGIQRAFLEVRRTNSENAAILAEKIRSEDSLTIDKGLRELLKQETLEKLTGSSMRAVSSLISGLIPTIDTPKPTLLQEVCTVMQAGKYGIYLERPFRDRKMRRTIKYAVLELDGKEGKRYIMRFGEDHDNSHSVIARRAYLELSEINGLQMEIVEFGSLRYTRNSLTFFDECEPGITIASRLLKEAFGDKLKLINKRLVTLNNTANVLMILTPTQGLKIQQSIERYSRALLRP
jgi:hypothetical protein